MSARKACQSGNAYPGCRPPSANSLTEESERSPNSTSFRTRARWKIPSPPISPATCQRRRPRTMPAAQTSGRPGIAGTTGRRNAKGAAQSAVTRSRTSASASEPWTRKTTPMAAKMTPRPHARVAEVLRTPTARARIAPGASTRAVAAASRSRRKSELIARSASERRPSRASGHRRGTSRPAARGRAARGRRAIPRSSMRARSASPSPWCL